jgi:hypothetical protein
MASSPFHRAGPIHGKIRFANPGFPALSASRPIQEQMMLKSLVVLAAVSTMSGPVFAQAAQYQSQTQAQGQGQAQQPAKPQTVKKRVCEQIDENPYSRLGNRKICKTIEVPVTPTNGQATQTDAPAGQKGN